MKRPLVLWKCLVSEKTVNRETLLEMIFSCEQQKMKSGFLYLFLHLKSLHISITNTIHMFICLVLPPPFLVATSSALSTPWFPQGAACAPSVSPPSLSLSVVLPCPCLPPHFCPVFGSVFGEKLPRDWLGASCSWHRWTVLSLLWQDRPRSLFSTQMTDLAKAAQGGVGSTESIWERTTAQGHTVSLNQILASALCQGHTASCPGAKQHLKPTNKAWVTSSMTLGSPCQQGWSASQLPAALAATGDTQHPSPAVPTSSSQLLGTLIRANTSAPALDVGHSLGRHQKPVFSLSWIRLLCDWTEVVFSPAGDETMEHHTAAHSNPFTSLWLQCSGEKNQSKTCISR